MKKQSAASRAAGFGLASFLLSTRPSQAAVSPSALGGQWLRSALRVCAAMLGLLVTAVAWALPTVSVTSPATGSTFTAPAAITLTANATATSGQTITQVQFFRGGSTLIGTATRTSGTSTSGTYTFSWASVAAGSYSVTAKATDSTGTTTSSAVSLTVNANVAPTVSITSPASGSTFTAPAAITLTATSADTGGGTISQVQFFRGGTTLIGTATLSGGTASNGTYTFNWTSVAAGSYSVTAKATDNGGLVTTSSAINLTVAANVAPTVSVTSPAAGTVFASPANITLTANAADSNGTVSQVQFFRGGSTLIGTATLSSGTSASGTYTFNWNNVANGNYSITAKATDNNSAVTTSSAVAIQVHNNVAPAVTMTTPANGTTYTDPASITFTANAVDSDGGVAVVKFRESNFQTFSDQPGTLTSGTQANGTYSFTWNNPPPGFYNVVADATDLNGATGSGSVGITVKSNYPKPIFNMQPSYMLAPPSGTLQVLVDATTDFGTITQVAFFADGSPIGTATSTVNGYYSVTWTGVSAGNHVLTATATNSGGFSKTTAPFNVTVVLNSPPTISVTTSGPQVYRTGSAGVPTIPFDITTSDPDGTVDHVDVYVNVGFSNQFLGTISNPAAGTPIAFTGWNNVTWYGGQFSNGMSTYKVYAVAFDNQGMATTSANLNFVVAQHTAPYVENTTAATTRAGPNGATVTLNQYASDGDGYITGVQFYSIVSGNTTPLGAGARVSGTPDNGIWRLVLNNVPVGTYLYYAVATNEVGTSSTTNGTSTTIQAATPASISFDLPTAGQTFLARGGSGNVPVRFTIIPSSGDFITEAAVYAGTTRVGTIPNPATYIPVNYEWVGASPGAYNVTLRVTDITGYVTTSAPVAISVQADPGPAVTLTAPAASTVLAGPSGATIALSATANDTDDGVAGVKFYDGATLVATGTLAGGDTAAGSTSTWTATWSGAPVGSHSLTAQAIDTLGTPSTSGAVVVNVVTSAAPTVTLASPSTNGPGVPVTLHATASDSDGTVARVEFRNGATIVATGTLTGGTAASGTWSGLWRDAEVGTYTLTAVAYDDLDNPGTSAPVTVTIAPQPNQAQTGMYFIGFDHLGTPRVVENQSQQAVWKWDNAEAFGDSVPNENPSGLGTFTFNQRFPGQYADVETGLNYNYNRFYDPNSATYISSDPIGLKGGISTYVYVHANPLWFIDMKGLSSSCPDCMPMSEEKCCETAGALGLVGTSEIPNTVICCNGRKVPCTNSISGGRSIGAQMSKECVRAHEVKHIGQVGECSKSCGVFESPDWNPGQDPRAGEVDAYLAERDCLMKALGMCQGDAACVKGIQSSINIVNNRILYYGGRP
jgi:RHS repeat-associated protein